MSPAFFPPREHVNPTIYCYADNNPEYAGLLKWAKERYRGIQGVAGSVFISGRWQEDTKYPLSEAAKSEIDKIRAPFKKVVAEGKWFSSFTKL